MSQLKEQESGPALLCPCPWGHLNCKSHIQGQLYCVSAGPAIQNAAAGPNMGSYSYLTLMTPGTALLPAVGGKRQEEGASLPHPRHCMHDCLGLSQKCYILLLHYVLRLVVTLGWLSAQVHGSSLVVSSGSLLAQTALVASCRGHLSQAHSCQRFTSLARVLLVSRLLLIQGARLGLPGTRLVVISGSLFLGNVRLPIIQIFIGPNLNIGIASLLSSIY